MNKKLVLPLIVGSLISALTLFLAFRNVPIDDLASYLGTINYWWILPTAGLIIFTFILRAFRWQIILKDARQIKYWQAFHPLMIGFMMNCVLPGRVGEIARPIILKKQVDIPITTGLATVAAERVFDVVLLIVLFAFLSTSITSQPNLDRDYFGLHLNSQTLVAIAWGLIRLSVVLLVFIALLTITSTRRIIMRFILWVAQLLASLSSRCQPYVDRLASIIIRLIENFASGLALVKNPGRLIACLSLTILIWGITALSYFVFALGCPGIRLSFMELTTVMVVICFFIALPSVPGFWGLWEAAGVFALTLYGVVEKDALGFTLINHATQLFPVIIVGLISALITSVNFFNLSNNDNMIINNRSLNTGD